MLIRLRAYYYMWSELWREYTRSFIASSLSPLLLLLAETKQATEPWGGGSMLLGNRLGVAQLLHIHVHIRFPHSPYI